MWESARLSAASLRPHPWPEPTLLGRGGRVPEAQGVSGGLSGTVCDPAYPKWQQSSVLPCGAGGSQEPASESSRPNIKHLLSSVVRSTKYKREKAPSPGSSVEAAGRSWRAQASNAAQLEHSTLS